MTPEDIMKAALFFLTVAGAGWGIWWRIEAKTKVAEEKAGKLAEDLAEFKLKVAETYATKAGMEAQTSQIMRAIESIGNRIDGLTERLDRIYENQPRRSTRS